MNQRTPVRKFQAGNRVRVSLKFTILFFFLHRRSHRRADMPGCLLLSLSRRQPMSAYDLRPTLTSACASVGCAHAHARLVVFLSLCRHVKRGRCSRDAGVSGKARVFTPNPARRGSYLPSFLLASSTSPNTFRSTSMPWFCRSRRNSWTLCSGTSITSMISLSSPPFFPTRSRSVHR
jgi:hypothetical protein